MKKLISIEYLKVLSILYIVGFWHLFNYTDAFPAYYNPLTSRITLIVLGVFVIISGYLIGIVTKQSNSALVFYKKRLLRIYPLYFIAVLIFYFYSINDFETSLKAIFLISMYSGPAPWTLWFITMLMLLYLATPLFLNFIEKPLYFFILIGAIMMATIILDILYKGVDTRLLLYLPCYGLGLYSSRYSFSDKFVNNKTAFITLMIGIISTLINTESILFTQLKHIPLVISSSYLILSFSHSHEEQLPSFQIIEFLSYSSFSIYLFHRPIFITLKSLYFPESGMLQIVYLMSICMLSICIISWLAHVNAAANPQIIAAVFCH